MAALHIHTHNKVTRIGQGVSRKAQTALYEGAQYLWDKECLMQNVSILWRTKYDGDSMEGLSGAVLCLGKPEDKTCHAICFQNFETPLLSRELLVEDHRPAPENEKVRIRIKGGFLLPEEIRNAEILCHPSSTPPTLSTFPTRSDPKGELRKSFSSTELEFN